MDHREDISDKISEVKREKVKFYAQKCKESYSEKKAKTKAKERNRQKDDIKFSGKIIDCQRKDIF